MSVILIWLILLLIIPKAPSSSQVQYYAWTVAAILSFGEIMLFLYSYYAKEGLVCITLASPLFWQPSYLECTKVNI